MCVSTAGQGWLVGGKRCYGNAATTMAVVMMAPCTHLIESGFTGFYLQKHFSFQFVNLRNFRNEVTVTIRVSCNTPLTAGPFKAFSALLRVAVSTVDNSIGIDM